MKKISKNHTFPLKSIAEVSNKEIGKRLYQLRNILVLKPEDVAGVLSITVNTIKRAESGEGNVGIENLLELISFYGYTERDFFDFKRHLVSWKSLRSRMIKYHKNTGVEILRVLNKQPDLIDLIEFRMLATDFFDDWKDADKTISYCKTTYTFDYLPTSVPNTLDNAVKKGWLAVDDKAKPKRYKRSG